MQSALLLWLLLQFISVILVKVQQQRKFTLDILIGLLIKIIDVMVAIISVSERKASKLLSEFFKSKQGKANI